MRYKIFVPLLLLFGIFLEAVEYSIVPLVEYYENETNLPADKLSGPQFAEIQELLDRKKERIRVLSYNILLNMNDLQLPVEYRWPERMPRILEAVRFIVPDVIGMQELFGNQFQPLYDNLKDTYDFYGPANRLGERNGIFYRRSRFTMVHSESDENMTLLVLKEIKTGKTFAIFNTHLFFKDIERRTEQVQAIALKVKALSKEHSIILTGDLNSFPTRFDLARLPFYDGDYILRTFRQQAHLEQASYLSVLGHLGPLSTFTNEGEDTQPFVGTGTPGVVLDHILVSPDIHVLIHAIDPLLVRGFFPSDHMPVFADLLLPAKKTP